MQATLKPNPLYRGGNKSFLRFLLDWAAIITLVLCFVIFTLLKGSSFMSENNMINILRAMSITTVFGIAATVLNEAGLHDITLFGSAKGVERKKGMEQIVFPDRDEVVRLPADHPGLHLIQQMQDEAHRFAIIGHRAKRAKNREGSSLDDIEGIGPKKRAQLLKTFGSVRGLAAASVEDIKRVEGISDELAERIYGALH